jgi:hypothetical protein
MGKPAPAAPEPEGDGHLISAGQEISPFARNFVLIFYEELMAKFYGAPPLAVQPKREPIDLALTGQKKRKRDE